MLPVEVIKLWRERIGTNVEIHNVYDDRMYCSDDNL